MLACLIGLMLAAALGDMRHYIITNKLNMIIACLAVPYWIGLSHGFNAHLLDIAKYQIVIASVTFIIGYILFCLNAIGGGDVKMLPALFLWIPAYKLETTVLVIAFAGLAVSIIVILVRLINKSSTNLKTPMLKQKVPYGVAIATGGIVFASQPFLNAFMK